MRINCQVCISFLFHHRKKKLWTWTLKIHLHLFHFSPNSHLTLLLYIATACRHFIAATWETKGEKGVKTTYFNGEEGVAREMNRGKRMERDCWSLKGINLASSMSSTQQRFQILSGGYLLTMPVCLSVTLSVSIFSSERDNGNLFFCCGFVLLF